MINGRSIQDYRIKDLRAYRVCRKNRFYFAMSIKDNIRFGNPTLPDEAVVEATKICGLYDDIGDAGRIRYVNRGGRSAFIRRSKQRLSMARALVGTLKS